jgi:DNA-binding NtrC family response regulator
VFDTSKVNLLLADDDDGFRESVARRIRRKGYSLTEASNGNEALEILEAQDINVAILDLMMPGKTGLEVLKKFREKYSDCEIIILTGQSSVETAVESLKAGAYDYLQKPFPLSELEILIQKAYERNRLIHENKQLKAVLARNRPNWNIIGNSPAIRQVFRLIDRAGPSDKSILIQGESGTGKELVAHALHASSKRSENPVITVNCAALSEQLLESELFGHEQGAFTGALEKKIGLIELADQGTLFIDEIGEMPIPMQVKLLRVLEDGSFRRVGSTKERRVDMRLISATNKDLEKESRDGNFREDLLYRINVLSIDIPPLRERNGDIDLLLNHFLGEGWNISAEAKLFLKHYQWPGNIRQFHNIVERAKILADHSEIQAKDLPASIKGAFAEENHTDDNICSSDKLAAIQRQKIVEIMKRKQGNKTRAAEVLGLTRRSLYRLLEKHSIQKEEYMLHVHQSQE